MQLASTKAVQDASGYYPVTNTNFPRLLIFHAAQNTAGYPPNRGTEISSSIV
jgi:hypothetical protein